MCIIKHVKILILDNIIIKIVKNVSIITMDYTAKNTPIKLEIIYSNSFFKMDNFDSKWGLFEITSFISYEKKKNESMYHNLLKNTIPI